MDSDEPVSREQTTGNGIQEYGKRHHGKRGTGYRTGYGTGDLCIPRHGFHLKSTPGNVAIPKPWEGSGENWAMRWDYVQVALCGVNSACVSALTAGMRCLASRATLPRALEYGHFGRGQVR